MVPAGTIHACRQPSSRTGRSVRPPIVARQPALRFSPTLRYEALSVLTSTRRSWGVHFVTCTYDGCAGGTAEIPPVGSTTAESMRNASNATGSSVFAPARRLSARHATKRMARPASTSAKVPLARVGTVTPSTRSFGPRPHGSDRRGPGSDRNVGMCGTVTSVTCGVSSGNRSVSRVVRIAANFSTPSGPIRPSRHLPWSPSTRTFRRPLAPGGRLIVTWRTQASRRHVSASVGSLSPVAGTQVVDGSSSKAERAMPAGSFVATELAVTLMLGSVLMNRWISLVSMSAAVPDSFALVAEAALKTRSKANPSSSCRCSWGEQTHRTEPRMQPDSRPGARVITAVPSPGVAGSR